MGILWVVLGIFATVGLTGREREEVKVCRDALARIEKCQGKIERAVIGGDPCEVFEYAKDGYAAVLLAEMVCPAEVRTKPPMGDRNTWERTRADFAKDEGNFRRLCALKGGK